MNYASASFILSFGLIILLVQILSYWQVFYKAGYEGWKSIIPIYNIYIMTKIAKQPVWVFIIQLVPMLHLIGAVYMAIGVAKVFGKSAVFGIFGLFVFSYFGYMYLGWGQSKYVEGSASAE